MTQYKTSSEAQQQYNQTLTFYEQYKDYTGMNAVISQGSEDGSPYFIANPNPMNNNTLILASVSGPYFITEANYATVASQTLLLSYLQGLLSQL
ncbi:hypothetical protein [Metallosphaera hakonensis]|uniref:hypothetical protein n=1 Tax=Metallosphaera hakonensis TaxID=79601 RepID=UPI0006D137D9|nr:hypothetical protein [Metallosphaera hakonensis]